MTFYQQLVVNEYATAESLLAQNVCKLTPIRVEALHGSQNIAILVIM